MLLEQVLDVLGAHTGLFVRALPTLGLCVKCILPAILTSARADSSRIMLCSILYTHAYLLSYSLSPSAPSSDQRLALLEELGGSSVI